MKTVKELTDLLGPGIPLLVHNERKAADGSPVYKVCQTKVQVEIAKRFGFVEAAAEPVMSIKEEVAEPKKAPARRGRKPKAK